MATVIRVIKYEGDEKSISRVIQQSKPLGTHEFGGTRSFGPPQPEWKLTIAEHYNDLPKQVELSEEEVHRSLADVRLKKLLGYMLSNVKEGGWEEVEKVGAIACWISAEDALAYLDRLPECNAGLMEKVKQ